MSDAITEQFFRWMEANNIKRAEAAEMLDVDERSLSTYRSRGLPAKKVARAEAIMAQSGAGTREPDDNIIRVSFSDEDFDTVDKASKIVDTSIKDFVFRAAVHFAKEEIAKSAALPIQHAPNVTAFPEVPLLRAAAGSPILADAEMIEPDHDLGAGRFILELRGDSMEPRFRDRQRVILRDRASLKRPVLKYGELYCFVHEGQACFKAWAKADDGQKVLRSLNPDHADIEANEETDWIGWFDPSDNA